ncbi:MAG: DegQ family serine endoprotease [Deltaproteobacteria bacterium]|nr:DegQ family serine endoprotease [Deltaproteobacteria bacterium]
MQPGFGWTRLCTVALSGAVAGAILTGSVVSTPEQLHSPACRPASSALRCAVERVSELLTPAAAEAHYPAVDLADVAERATAAVVNISSTKISKVPEHLDESPSMDNPLFRQFFGLPPGFSLPQERRTQSLGSGVIASADGMVLTNNHVVEQADEIRVTLADRREFDAEIVGRDPKSDIAVVRLKGDLANLHVLPFGDSDQLRLADTVLAIGNPFGVGQTVTMGIVSATGRANVGIADYEDFIQTDAAINPGNSGGALLNIRGELVGINTAIVSRSGGYQGVGFAIPSNMAREIMNSLVATGKVQRGWLGVAIQPIDRDLAEALGVDQGRGVLVADVTANGPAAEAGIERGDVITAIDGKAIESTGQLRNIVAGHQIGTKVKVDVIRDKKEKTFRVGLGELPRGKDDEPQQESRNAEGPLSGLTVDNLTADTRERFEVPAAVARGALVTGIQRNAAAARTGVTPGDVILEINRKQVRNADDFRSLAAKVADDESALLLLARRGGTAFLLVKP